MQSGIGNVDFVDGYLSDVPSHTSNAPSDVSHDLRLAQNLEQHFKDKYMFLRVAYEKRLRDLSKNIDEALSNTVVADIVTELRSDNLSAGFIAPFLCETLAAHLNESRETFIHDVVAKMSSLEVENSKLNDTLSKQNQKIKILEQQAASGRRAELSLEPLKCRLAELEAEFGDFVAQSEKETAALRDRNHSLEAANLESARQIESLKEESESIRHRSAALETSFEQSTRNLQTLQSKSDQDRDVQTENRLQIQHLKASTSELRAELESYQSKYQACAGELDRTRLLLQQKEKSTEKIPALMAQVQEILTTETEESNAAITTMHEKMKALRHKCSLELQRERRLTSTLRAELLDCERLRDDHSRDLRLMGEEVAALREKLAEERERVAASRTQSDTLHSANATLRAQLQALESQVLLIEGRTKDERAMRDQELRLAVARTRLETSQEMDKETLHLERVGQAHRMRYENEQIKLQQDLRNSLILDPRESMLSFVDAESVKHVSHPHSIAHERSNMSFDRGAGHGLSFGVDPMLSMDRGRNSSGVSSHSQAEVSVMKERVGEAAQHIERLHTMVREYKSKYEAMESTNERLQELLQRQQAQLDEEQERNRRQQSQSAALGSAQRRRDEHSEADVALATTRVRELEADLAQMKAMNMQLMQSLSDSSNASRKPPQHQHQSQPQSQSQSLTSLASASQTSNEDDVVRLQSLLVSGQAQAKADHDEFQRQIDSMRSKFDNLLKSHEAATARAQETERRLQRELAVEQERVVATAQKLEVVRRAFRALSGVAASLRGQVGALRGEVTSLRTQASRSIASMARDTSTALQMLQEKAMDTIRAIRSADAKQSHDRMHQLRVELLQAHELERSALEQTFVDQLSSQKDKSDKELQRVTADLCTRAQSVIQSMSSNSSSGSGITSTESDRGSTSLFMASPKDVLGFSALGSTSSNKENLSWPTSISSAPLQVLEALLGILVVGSLIDDAVKNKVLQLCAPSHPRGGSAVAQPSSALAGAATAMLDSAIAASLLKYQFPQTVSTSLAGNLTAPKGQGGPDQLSDYDQSLSHISNISAMGSQSNNDLIVQLSKIESETQLRALRSQIDHAQHRHGLEVKRLSAEHEAAEQAARNLMNEQIAQVRAEERSKCADVESKLRGLLTPSIHTLQAASHL